MKCRRTEVLNGVLCASKTIPSKFYIAPHYIHIKMKERESNKITVAKVTASLNRKLITIASKYTFY